MLLGALAGPLVACARPGDPFSSLERKYSVRLGVYAVDTGSGAFLEYRADERFAFCSTFKTIAVAAVLWQRPLSYLDTVVRYTKADVNSISPIADKHVDTGMTVGQLCDAAIRYSDGTAGNLLMRDIGGPAQLTAYLRGLGDPTSRMDQYEPDLNSDPPGDPRDTSTPRALAGDHRAIVLGNALPPEKQSLVKDWLRRSATGAQTIRAGVPAGWTVAGKTGHGDYGRANDVAVVWPPNGAPLVIAVMSDRAGFSDEPRYPVIADVAAHVTSVLR
nr:class A beta-lactamase [Pseudonocardia acaciae]